MGQASSHSMPYLPVDMVFRFFPRWTRDKAQDAFNLLHWPVSQLRGSLLLLVLLGVLPAWFLGAIGQKGQEGIFNHFRGMEITACSKCCQCLQRSVMEPGRQRFHAPFVATRAAAQDLAS